MPVITATSSATTTSTTTSTASATLIIVALATSSTYAVWVTVLTNTVFGRLAAIAGAASIAVTER